MDFREIGVSGLRAYSGYVHEAYATELLWPNCQPLYSRLRRSDPQIAAVRQVFSALVRGCSIDWELPDKPKSADKKAQEFAQQVIDDIDGGPGAFLDTMISNTPFYGWGWWEVLPGLRKPGWTAPGEDGWQSEYKDGKIGIRRLAWRDPSSFQGWDLTDTGQLRGMVQVNYPRPAVKLPLDRSLHLVLGDNHNPEGLSPLEAVWRLERIVYGLEVVQGIGFEHTAGILKFSAEQGLTPADEPMIEQSARNAMSAQEGNYLALPKGVTAEMLEVGFAAAGSILEAIRYFGLLKLQVFLSQWIAIASTAGTGAYSAMSDASSMFMTTFNAMLDGFASQMDAQVGRRLFQWNEFPGMTKRPRLIIKGIDKSVALGELGSIITAINNIMPLGEDDMVAIRKRTGFLPETLPEIESKPKPEPVEPPADEPQDGEETPADSEDQGEDQGEDQPDGASDQPTKQQAEQALKLAEREAHWTRYLLRHPEAVKHG